MKPLRNSGMLRKSDTVAKGFNGAEDVLTLFLFKSSNIRCIDLFFEGLLGIDIFFALDWNAATSPFIL